MLSNLPVDAFRAKALLKSWSISFSLIEEIRIFPSCCLTSIFTSGGRAPSEDTSAVREEPVPGEKPGLSVPDEPDEPDWRAALALSLSSLQENPVPLTRTETEKPQIRGENVNGEKACATPGIPPVSADGTEEPGNCEGWKKALYTPVRAALADEKQSAQPAGGVTSRKTEPVPAFEPLSSDSGLFDDRPSVKKMPGAPAPEPAEQWKSMGINRGENSSV